MKKAGWVFAIAFLGLTALAGLANAINELDQAETALQQSVQYGDALWAILGVAAAFGMWRRRPWAVMVTLAWAVVVTYTGTVASFAFSDPAFANPETKAGVIGAGLSLTAIGALLVWAARVATRVSAAAPKTPV